MSKRPDRFSHSLARLTLLSAHELRWARITMKPVRSEVESTCRNQLEAPWNLDEKDFLKSAGIYRPPDVHLYRSVREETMSVMEEIGKVETEIDERVKALYGL